MDLGGGVGGGFSMCKVENNNKLQHKVVQAEKGVTPEVYSFLHCVTSQSKVNKVTQPKKRRVTQRTIHANIFLHHLGVIGSNFTEVEFHACFNFCIQLS